MTYSSLSDAVTGFKSDADRVDTFGNGDANATYTSKTGAIVPSIQNLIGQWNYSINVAANGILAQSTAQAGIATTQAGNAATSAGAAAMTKAAIDSRYYPNSATDPTTRPDGSARQSGDRYFNTASSVEKVYDGATWTIANVGAADLANPTDPAKGAALLGYSGNTVKASLDDLTPRAQYTRKILATRISDATISGVRLVPFEMESQDTINRITGYVGVADTTGKLVEIGIYDVNFNKLVSSEVREIPDAGDFSFSIPETVLVRGRYYFGICTNSTTAQFGVNPYQGALTCTAAFPTPTVAASPTSTAVAPVATILGKDLPVTQGLFSYATGNVRVYGIDVTGGNQPWGLDTTTFKFVKSIDNGNTWQQMMSQPPNAAQEGSTLQDMIITGGQLYVFTNKCTLWVSSDLTATATWTNISCPTTTGLRHAQAVGRPYGIAAFNGYIYIGEYSQAPNEFAPDGPRILRYNIAAGTWALSKEFAGARHVHSFYTPGSAVMYVSLGDANYGADVGIHRITPSQIGTGTGGADAYTKWTNISPPFTSHYPVDLIVRASPATYNGRTAPAGLYCASDRPGKHILFCKTTGVAGNFNMNAQIFERAGGPSTETVRSVIFDAYNNLYYWTSETTEQALYVSPPPYTQTIKLMSFPASPTLFLSRSVLSGDYIMMFNQRFHIEKFIGQ